MKASKPAGIPGTSSRKRVALGIDPGTAIVGYSVIESRDDAVSLKVCDVIRTSPDMPFPMRLQHIYLEITRIIKEFQPQEAAMEELFFAKNARTALTVGQARGVAILAISHAGLTISEYTPIQVKQAIHGYGRATKDQVGEMVKILLGLSYIPKPDDAADAAAIAICHLNSTRIHV